MTFKLNPQQNISHLMGNICADLKTITGKVTALSISLWTVLLEERQHWKRIKEIKESDGKEKYKSCIYT